MESSKAKIEKFFGGNEKLGAIANNKEFIEKVAGGQATPETYQEELGKLGLELTLEEAKEVQTATERAMDIPPEKLNEAVLGSIAGGGAAAVGAAAVGGLATLASGMGTIGCGIAGIVYQFKTRTALKCKDLKEAEKCNKRSLQLLGASAGLAVGTVVSMGVAVGGAVGTMADNIIKSPRYKPPLKY